MEWLRDCKASKIDSMLFLVFLSFSFSSSGAVRGETRYERRTIQSQYNEQGKQRPLKNRAFKNHKKTRPKYYNGDYAAGLHGFLYYCQLELDYKSTDGTLSQNDYADFLYDYCLHSPKIGPECVEPPKNELFSSLPWDVQLHFVADICSGDSEAKISCLANLNQQDTDFGLTKDIHELCTSTYPLLESSGMLNPGEYFAVAADKLVLLLLPVLPLHL